MLMFYDRRLFLKASGKMFKLYSISNKLCGVHKLFDG